MYVCMYVCNVCMYVCISWIVLYDNAVIYKNVSLCPSLLLEKNTKQVHFYHLLMRQNLYCVISEADCLVSTLIKSY